MKTSGITKAVLTEDGQVLIRQPDGSYREAGDRTDWDRMEQMDDEDIEAAARDDLDAPAMAGKTEWWKARLVTGKAQITLRLDRDILDWFRDQGPGYQTRINAVLRQYKESHTRNA